MNSQKIITIIAGVIGVIAMFFLIRIIGVGDEAIKAGESSGMVNTFMYIAYAVLALILVLVVLFTLKNVFTNAATLKSTLMGVGAFLVVALISYFMASGIETPMKDGEVLSASGSKLVGAGLNMFYILAVIAIGSMLFSGIKKMIK
ncbi:hypothetical protein DFR65_101315 [Oceanihabitans sediminis]|uniref:Uncharacterized protein n=1 Tax=Oceanihabitans sediminis TaxID=1812012 RepID=A0A368P5D2_9FLAO|nr:hypothetical protein [Oceanihabitans sediminis]RBP34423.1 hypothetical protein DFR65_101315 [Oceanihabitans sediminis]RCU58097.1 hypothetical protein DU428_01555 [Oceanihabitans sediminis]